MHKLSDVQRNKLRYILRKRLILKRFKRSINRNYFKAVANLNKIANDPNNKNPDAVIEVCNHSVLKNNKNKKLAMFFVFKMNQRDRNKVLAELEKEAVIEEVEELVRDKE